MSDDTMTEMTLDSVRSSYSRVRTVHVRTVAQTPRGSERGHEDVRRPGTSCAACGVSSARTERKRAEADRAALLASERAARQSAEEAVRAREQFLAIASHELRTPLTPLKLQLQLMSKCLQRDAVTEGKMAAKVAIALQQVERLERLAEQLLDASRISAGPVDLAPEPVELVGLVKEVLARANRDRVGPALVLHAEGSVVGNWDRAKLDKVIGHLISNALKFGGGREVEVRVQAVGSRATLTVVDHGIGITADALPRVFERFERAVPAKHFGGFGLGLYIAQKIVEGHGGHICVASAPGEGSTFVVHLPLEQPEARDEVA